MKQFKKLIACVLAATLVLGSTTVFFGTEKETRTQVDLGGSGEWEGTVDKKVFNVKVPTVAVTPAATAFDFILDPEGLIQTTSGAHYKTSDKSYSFVTYGSMYFKVSDDAYDVKSQVLTAENKSSVEVNITLQASVTVPTTNSAVTFVTGNAWTSSDTGLEIYLAVAEVSGDAIVSEKAIAEKSGNTYATTVTSSLIAFNAYETVYNASNGKYEYVIATDAATRVSADTYSFCLTGACNSGADWSGYTKGADPVISIVWKVEMEGTEEASTSFNNNVTTFNWSKTNGVSLNYTLSEGEEIVKLQVGPDGTTWARELVVNVDYTLENGKIILTKEVWKTIDLNQTRYLQIQLKNAEAVILTATIVQ